MRDLMISDLIELGYMAAGFTVLTLLVLAHPRTRRVAYALLRFTKRHAPKWLGPLLVLGAFVPGQADEAIMIAIALVPVLRNARKRRLLARYVTWAWQR